MKLEDIKNLRFIHYGSKGFDIELWREIKNLRFNKPSGGLWAAPLPLDSWKEWCLANNFSYNLEFYFTFELTDSARILIIDSEEDLVKLPILTKKVHYFDNPSELSFLNSLFDFESLRNDYDAIYLTSKGESKTRYTRPMSLYGWDLESLLVLNKEVIKL